MSAATPPTPDENPNALPAGTRLGEFELRGLLGVGGFGIVYLAFDHALEREVAVKEYMPASLAGRTATMYVSLRSQSDAETFSLGLKSFVNEARLLARFDHPSLLKVYRFWEANGTAYMAMPVLRGRTVKEVRMQMQGSPDETWLRGLLTPLLGAIENLHAEGVFHRDIAPDNIQVEPDGRPVLLDFGAARRVISDKTQSLTAILKPAYAPIEQYAEAGSVKQGPWTDIYALGATLHYLLLGRPPSPATARAIHDEASSLTHANLPACSEDFLAIVNWMLAPRPSDRPQSVAILRSALQGQTRPPMAPPAPAPDATAWAATMVLPRAASAPAEPHGAGRAETAAAAPPVLPVPPVPAERREESRGAPTRRPPPAAAAPEIVPPKDAPPAVRRDSKRSSRMLPLALGAGAALALGAVLWPRQPAPQPLAEGAASAAAALVVPSAPAASQADAAFAPQPDAVSPAIVASASAPAASAVAPAAPVIVATPAPAPTPRKSAPAQVKAAGATARSEIAPPSSTAGLGSTSPGPPPMSRPPPVEEAATARPPAAAAAEPAKTHAQVPAPAPQQAAAPAPEVPRVAGSGPEATCSGRPPVRYFVCMERECLKSANTSHADCLNWRKSARRE